MNGIEKLMGIVILGGMVVIAVVAYVEIQRRDNCTTAALSQHYQLEEITKLCGTYNGR